MAHAPAFEVVCGALEERTSLSRIEARGTVRLALRKAGLDADTVSPQQMAIVLARVLPEELGSRGVEDAAGVCSALEQRLGSVADGGVSTPDSVFERLGG